MTPYMQTYTGKFVHVINPYPGTITLDDIALPLSRICRFNGHTKYFYSVAEHSYYCSRLAEEEEPNQPGFALACLLHDAAEAYLGDVPSPVKQHLPQFETMENHFLRVIFKKYGLSHYAPTPTVHYTRPVPQTTDHRPESSLLGWEDVMKIDRRILFTEKRDILTDSSVEWDIPPLPPADWKITTSSTEDTYTLFLNQFYLIMKKLSPTQ